MFFYAITVSTSLVRHGNLIQAIAGHGFPGLGIVNLYLTEIAVLFEQELQCAGQRFLTRNDHLHVGRNRQCLAVLDRSHIAFQNSTQQEAGTILFVAGNKHLQHTGIECSTGQAGIPGSPVACQQHFPVVIGTGKALVNRIGQNGIQRQRRQQLTGQGGQTANHLAFRIHRDKLGMRAGQSEQGAVFIAEEIQQCQGFGFLSAHNIHLFHLSQGQRCTVPVLQAADKMDGQRTDIRQLHLGQVGYEILFTRGSNQMGQLRQTFLGGQHTAGIDAPDAVITDAVFFQQLIQQALNGSLQGSIAAFIGMFIANTMMCICGFAGIRAFSKVLSVPKVILTPIIFALCIIGSFAMKNSLFDVWVMLIAGVVGYFMSKSKVPTSPAILGLILGPMAEKNFRTALLKFGGNPAVFFSTMIRRFFIVLIIGSLFGSQLKDMAGKVFKKKAN